MATNLDHVQRFWYEVVQFRTHVYYLQLHQMAAEAAQWRLDVILALATSGSIAAWAVWGQYPMIWACIVAISQVATVLKPYLPYPQRIKAISASLVQWNFLL